MVFKADIWLGVFDWFSLVKSRFIEDLKEEFLCSFSFFRQAVYFKGWGFDPESAYFVNDMNSEIDISKYIEHYH